MLASHPSLHWHPALRSLLVICVVALSGCIAVSVETQHDPEASFDGLHSYAWAPGLPSAPSDTDESPTDQAFDDRLVARVDQVLTGRGYERTTADGADFWIRHIAVVQETSQELDLFSSDANMQGSVPSWAPPHDRVVTRFDKGTLMLDVLEPKTRKLLWRGIAEAVVDKSDDQKRRDERLDKAIHELLDRFPPK